MSRRTEAAEGRERYAPADRKLAEKLFELAREIADFANDATEVLSFGEYADLMEYETKLLAFGNLLCTSDIAAYLDEEIASAEDHLGYLKYRVGENE